MQNLMPWSWQFTCGSDSYNVTNGMLTSEAERTGDTTKDETVSMFKVGMGKMKTNISQTFKVVFSNLSIFSENIMEEEFYSLVI